MGAVFMALLGAFFISLLFVTIKNAQTDIDIMSATNSQVKSRSVSGAELGLMQEWIGDNNIQIPEGQSYRYILRTYPDRPWLMQ